MGPPSPRQQFGPRHSVVFLLSKLGSLAGRSFAACLEPLGLEPRQFAVLNFIALDEGRSQQALGDALEIPASRMVAIVDDLESRAIVERRTNPADRRARALYLTARGKDLLRKARDVVQTNEAEFCQDLDVATRDRLIAMLLPLAERQGHVLGVHPALTNANSDD
jgi:DNA-binding MarR family transcriptional regulator